jgi:hypothetical protein
MMNVHVGGTAANRFKAGDRVTPKRSEYGLEAGTEYVVAGEARPTLDGWQRWIMLRGETHPLSTDGSFMEDGFELVAEAKFKVGDRVRAIVGDDAGGFSVGDIFVLTGAYGDLVVFTDNDGHKRNRRASEFELVPVDAPTTKFKVGDRVRIASGPENGGFGEVGDVGVIEVDLSTRGEILFETGARKNQTWCVDYRHLEPAPTKFKVGDRVTCRHTHRRGPGTIIKLVSGGAHVRYDNWREWHDGHDGWAGDGSTNCWWDPLAAFDAAPPTPNPAIVARLQQGQPLPAGRPYVHADVAAATAEAERLARKIPGAEFGVYELVARRREAKQYAHEWQRLAASGEKIAAIKILRGDVDLTLKGAKDAVEHWLACEAN